MARMLDVIETLNGQEQRLQYLSKPGDRVNFVLHQLHHNQTNTRSARQSAGTLRDTTTKFKSPVVELATTALSHRARQPE